MRPLNRWAELYLRGWGYTVMPVGMLELGPRVWVALAQADRARR